jgi:hypothetical protein
LPKGLTARREAALCAADGDDAAAYEGDQERRIPVAASLGVSGAAASTAFVRSIGCCSYGPPGNGKTLTCYWMAKELGIPMYRVICNELRVGVPWGMRPRAVAACRRLPERPLRSQRSACGTRLRAFLSIEPCRQGTCDREISSALTVFLQALDRWKAPTLIVMATNLPDQLDPGPDVPRRDEAPI